MMAEVVVDVLNAALGVDGEVRRTTAAQRPQAIEVGASRCRARALGYAFRIFGRPPRTTACDCERAMEPALPQKLFLMTDPTVLAEVERAKAAGCRNCSKAKTDDDECSTSCSWPRCRGCPPTRRTDCVRRASQDGRTTRQSGVSADTLWALINTREFILNH